MFQFTPVLRRATILHQQLIRLFGFNSRPSCDGRRIQSLRISQRAVSIHARLATGDHYSIISVFNDKVSIHARLATGDFLFISLKHFQSFNSRPSCDGRRINNLPRRRVEFQFTPVLRRATDTSRRRRLACCFNSRPSCDGRPQKKLNLSASQTFL